MSNRCEDVVRVGSHYNAEAETTPEPRTWDTRTDLGGVTRVSISPPDRNAGSPLTAPRDSLAQGNNGVIGGSLRVSSDGRVEQIGQVVRSSTADSAYQPAGGGILATAQGVSGRGGGTLTPESTVQVIPGVEASRTSIGVACSMGYLRDLGNGNFLDLTMQQPAQGPARGAPQPGRDPLLDAPSPEAAPHVELFVPAVEAQVAAAIADVPQSMYDAAAVQAVSAGIDSIDYANVAATSGKTPEEIRQTAEMMHAEFTKQAKAAAHAGGVSADDWDGFVAWAHEHASEQIQEATLRHVLGRDPRGLRELAQQYLRSTPPSIEAVRAVGHRCWTDPSTGGDWVDLPGYGPLTVGAASKLGLL